MGTGAEDKEKYQGWPLISSFSKGRFGKLVVLAALIPCSFLQVSFAMFIVVPLRKKEEFAS